MAWTGKALASHLDKSARLESQVKQLIQMANQQQSKLDLRPLFDTIENMKQKIALMETYDQRLGTLALSCTAGGGLLVYWWASRGSGATLSQLELFTRKGFLLAFWDPTVMVCAVLSHFSLLHNVSWAPVALQGHRAGLGLAHALWWRLWCYPGIYDSWLPAFIIQLAAAITVLRS